MTLPPFPQIPDSAWPDAKPDYAIPAPASTSQVGGNHYKDMPIQPAEYCQRNGLNYCESACVRYVSRHKRKNGRQDIEKAIHCLQLLLEMEYPEKRAIEIMEGEGR